MEDDCIFCKIVKGEIKTEIICENDNFISFLDANPVVEGHSLVIPKKHFKTYNPDRQTTINHSTCSPNDGMIMRISPLYYQEKVSRGVTQPGCWA